MTGVAMFMDIHPHQRTHSNAFDSLDSFDPWCAQELKKDIDIDK